jgi:hypothetical protein
MPKTLSSAGPVVSLPRSISLPYPLQIRWGTVAKAWGACKLKSSTTERRLKLARGWRLEEKFGPDGTRSLFDHRRRIRAVVYSDHAWTAFIVLRTRYQISLCIDQNIANFPDYLRNDYRVKYFYAIFDNIQQPAKICWYSEAIFLRTPADFWLERGITDWMQQRYSQAVAWLNLPPESEKDEDRRQWRNPLFYWKTEEIKKTIVVANNDISLTPGEA